MRPWSRVAAIKIVAGKVTMTYDSGKKVEQTHIHLLGQLLLITIVLE